ncbi:hypothetical protein Bhyg_13571 [Pseudolycoriella hygida]|uniref:CHK kinase-like domain-containing protein n=1 Tax=Pseudolycoriella hygida TaxID=35572 RepID=A0A9Q0MNQ9_9DIPT|nr:hypothetical protein Bhyg_13571 [Pseudolycoriella hygida]
MKVPQQDLPKWINEQFFVKVIRSCVSDKDVKILSFSINSASKSNDPFASPIFRATVTVWSKQTPQTNFSFILKVPSAARPVKEDISFENEISVYSSTLDEMHRLLNRAGENTQLGPRVIYYTAESNAVIVLEDLDEKMYLVPETTLNLDKTLATIFKLARWHATSFFMAKEHQSVSSFASGIFNKKYSENLTFMYESYRYFVNEIKTWEGYDDYAERLSKLESSFFAKGKDIFTAKTNGFNVLNHGDLNYKNILTKGDNEKNDILFVDYQYCVWATPAIDIFSVLYLVASAEIRQRFRNELITYYYNEFVKTLMSIGNLSKPPSMLDLQIELQQSGFLEVVIAVCHLPFLLVNEDVINDKTATAKLREVAYSNPEFKSIIKSQLPYFLTKGFLN